ncbi:hypothetical protein BDQ12DRAFT_302556 [Crucibulum laeve]|uniref:Uncharacterized protein n=1 Tax=Crucibulum laeve TaxID=68775 RepID=A0A5C3MCE6_9AGAR|nr:hypothetical protein BDQ12DRAFT_302556 [Crucibulum laeve]
MSFHLNTIRIVIYFVLVYPVLPSLGCFPIRIRALFFHLDFDLVFIISTSLALPLSYTSTSSVSTIY